MSAAGRRRRQRHETGRDQKRAPRACTPLRLPPWASHSTTRSAGCSTGATTRSCATLNPDGGPQTSAMWVGRDGDDVVMSTLVGRRKYRNLERDPRASVTILDSDDPDNYVELRGRDHVRAGRRPGVRHRAVDGVRRPRPGSGPARRDPDDHAACRSTRRRATPRSPVRPRPTCEYFPRRAARE